ncbi:ISAs1 family transposase [Telmatocola sphagniphila]|uniref:ISAs1 family transposase n=1 Tax=Telmatocola sphagniphila TaxID=1123043 RepID=UPI0028F418EB|nr:ISAs1 family transposase [Telmatocola sphagniphila]
MPTTHAFGNHFHSHLRRGFRSQRLGGRRSFRRDQDRLVPEVSPLPNGIPSHDTFGRVFRYLDTDAFEACFASWMAEICVGTDLLQVAIDGKTMRSSGGPGQKCLHVVSAFATANRVTLGQEAVDDKSNEITAIPELLKRLDIAGKIVTIDAMGCQKKIAEAVRERDADYLLAVKDNQPTLLAEIKAHYFKHLESGFADVPTTFCESTEKNRGRVEYRSCLVFSDVNFLSMKDDWKGLKTVVVVVTDRRENHKSASEIRYYICSRASDAPVLAKAVREHWTIENNLHWSLDVTFGDDDSRVRKDNGPQNFARIKRLALSIVANASGKESMAVKRLKACASDERRELIIREFLQL